MSKDLEAAVALVRDFGGLSTGHADTCADLVEELLFQFAERRSLLTLQETLIHKLREDLVTAYRRLCSYEGHLPITDDRGVLWCELCQQEIGGLE